MTALAGSGAPPLDAADLWAILGAAGVGVLVTDAERRILFVNETFTRETGYGAPEVVGRTCAFLQGPGTDPEDVRALRAALDRAQAVERVVLNYHKDGSPLWYRLRIRPVFGAPGELRYFVGVQEDHSAAQAARAHLEELAYLDSLTGLGNRRAFDRHLARMVAAGHPFVLALFDLNDFKRVNDQRGHPAGDALLQEVARTLRAALPGGAQAYRVGGDEFAALLPGEVGGAVLDSVLGALARADGGRLRVGLGAAAGPREAGDAGGLLRLADARLYAHKAETKARAAAPPADPGAVHSAAD